jgi:signal transduction histidine kinase
VTLSENGFDVKPAWRKSLVFAAITSLAISFVFQLDLRDTIDNGFTRKIEYRVRAALDMAPPLDPRIKMIAFDDITAGVLQRPDLTLSDWNLLFEYLAKSQPKAIFIDRIFGLPLAAKLNSGIQGKEARDFIRRMQSLPSPVIVGSFFQKTAIVQREPLDIERSEYDLLSYLPADTQNLAMYDTLPWFRVESGYVFGPHRNIREAFPLIGSIDNEGAGFIRPFRRLSKRYAHVHASLLVAGDVKFRDGEFYTRDHRMPLDHDGRLIINFSTRQSYYQQTKNLLSYIKKINNTENDDWIDQDDIVAILPMMYTGNTDMKDVPIGRLQGSYVHVSAINNALHGNWLKEVPWATLIILLAGLLAAACANTFQITNFLIITICSSLCIVCIGLLLFCKFDLVFPWPYVTSAFLVSGIGVFVDRSKQIEKKRKQAQAKAEEGIRVRKLLHVVCHDIASPLMVMRTRLMMMGGDHRRVEQANSEASKIDKISYAAERIKSIVDSVRNLEAVEMGKANIQLEPVSISGVFSAMRVNFEDALAKKQITLTANIDAKNNTSNDLFVRADRTGLENFVIANLVSNAIKFSPRGGTIELKACGEQQRVRLEVIDQGVGIPKELLDHIFSSSAVTSRAGTADEQGTGFGMPIVKSYVDRFSGTIEVQSIPQTETSTDHGTTIIIYLQPTEPPAPTTD